MTKIFFWGKVLNGFLALFKNDQKFLKMAPNDQKDRNFWAKLAEILQKLGPNDRNFWSFLGFHRKRPRLSVF